MMQDDGAGNTPLRDIFQYVAWDPAAGGQAQQLVVLLHGSGLNGTLMQKMAQEVAAVLPHARIIAPHGPEPYTPPPRQEGDLLKAPEILGADKIADGRQWFQISGGPDVIREKLRRVARTMNDFIDNQRDITGVTDKDIAIMGFSQGGGVALYAAFLRGQEIGAVVGHSTIFYAEPDMISRPPALFLYGDADAEFSVKDYETSTAHLKTHIANPIIKVISGLQHRTSNESRRITAAFIRDCLTPPAP